MPPLFSCVFPHSQSLLEILIMLLCCVSLCTYIPQLQRAEYISISSPILTPTRAIECTATTQIKMLLSLRDSNPKFQNQNLTCYHYTTGQFRHYRSSHAFQRTSRSVSKNKCMINNSTTKVYQYFAISKLLCNYFLSFSIENAR